MKYNNNNEKYKKEKRGIGKLENYNSWLDKRSFPSKGRMSQIRGIKTNRNHVLFSNLEVSYFYLLEWDDEVIDIREQFPLLDEQEIINIADEKNIKLPKNKLNNTINVFTTDFFITKQINDKQVDIARTLKYAKDLEKKRTLELFEIERQYWKNKNIDWAIITEKDIPKILVNNIKWIYKFADLKAIENMLEIDEKDIIKNIKMIYEELYLKENRNKKLLNLMHDLDIKYNLKKGSSLSLFKYAIFKKIIKINNIDNIKLFKNPVIYKIIFV